MNSGNTNGAWCCPQYSEVTLVMTVSVLWKLVSDLCETGSWESLPASLLQSLLYLAEAMESEMVSELVELWRLHSFLQSAIPWWHWSTLVSRERESGENLLWPCLLCIYTKVSFFSLFGEAERLGMKKRQFWFCIEPSDLWKSLQ